MRQRAVSTDKKNAFQVLVLMFCLFAVQCNPTLSDLLHVQMRCVSSMDRGRKLQARVGFFLIEINAHGRYH